MTLDAGAPKWKLLSWCLRCCLPPKFLITLAKAARAALLYAYKEKSSRPPRQAVASAQRPCPRGSAPRPSLRSCTQAEITSEINSFDRTFICKAEVLLCPRFIGYTKYFLTKLHYAFKFCWKSWCPYKNTWWFLTDNFETFFHYIPHKIYGQYFLKFHEMKLM